MSGDPAARLARLRGRVRAARRDPASVRPGLELRAPLRDPAGARELRTPAGTVPVLEWRSEAPSCGRVSARLARYARDEGLARAEPERAVFLDAETTGLSRGAGTLAFLVGIARLERGAWVTRQLLLRDPADEPALLAALELLLAPASMLVSFNGRAFDVPLLRARFARNGLAARGLERPHLDLLHPARALFAHRLPDATLGTIERRVLGRVRHGRDLPGALAPDRWRAWLRTGDPSGVEDVIAHNRHDLASLPALLRRVEEGLERAPERGDDALASGALLERIGEADAARERFAAARVAPDPLVRAEAQRRYARACRRAGLGDEAERTWRELARAGDAGACVEMAKRAEHVRRDPEEALAWVASARRAGGGPGEAPDLARREARLRSRLARRAAR